MKFILIILTLSFNIFANDCLNQKDEMGFKWASGPIRKQGGGWIWFTGKGKAPTSQLSEDISIGQALERFKQECKSINQKIRIHESCTEKEDETYTSYSRLSIKDRHCQNGDEEENPTLIKKHKRYEKFISSQTSRLRNKKSALVNYYNNSSNQSFRNQVLSQMNYLKRKIENLNNSSNPYALNYFSDFSENVITPKNISKTEYIIDLYKNRTMSWAKLKKIAKKLCKSTPVSCYIYLRAKIWEKSVKDVTEEDIKLVERSCYRGYGPSCIYLARFVNEFSSFYNINKITVELNKYCKSFHTVESFDSENDDPCYALYIIFSENAEKAFEYAKISCSKIKSSNTILGNRLCSAYGGNFLSGSKLYWKKDTYEKGLFFYKNQCDQTGDCSMYNLYKDPICALGRCANPNYYRE